MKLCLAIAIALAGFVLADAGIVQIVSNGLRAALGGTKLFRNWLNNSRNTLTAL